jgi:hypothetical protein
MHYAVAVPCTRCTATLVYLARRSFKRRTLHIEAIELDCLEHFASFCSESPLCLRQHRLAATDCQHHPDQQRSKMATDADIDHFAALGVSQEYVYEHEPVPTAAEQVRMDPAVRNGEHARMQKSDVKTTI